MEETKTDTSLEELLTNDIKCQTAMIECSNSATYIARFTLTCHCCASVLYCTDCKTLVLQAIETGMAFNCPDDLDSVGYLVSIEPWG